MSLQNGKKTVGFNAKNRALKLMLDNRAEWETVTDSEIAKKLEAVLDLPFTHNHVSGLRKEIGWVKYTWAPPRVVTPPVVVTPPDTAAPLEVLQQRFETWQTLSDDNFGKISENFTRLAERITQLQDRVKRAIDFSRLDAMLELLAQLEQRVRQLEDPVVSVTKSEPRRLPPYIPQLENNNHAHR